MLGSIIISLSVQVQMGMTRLIASCLLGVAYTITLVGAAVMPMYPFGSEVIWKVAPIRDGYTKDILVNPVSQDFLKNSWGNCSKSQNM